MANRYDKIPSPEVTESGVANDPNKKQVGKWEDDGTGSKTWVPKPTSRPLDPGFAGPAQSKPKPKPTSTPQGSQPNHYVTNSKNHTRVIKGD
jgi:hypothetical protein